MRIKQLHLAIIVSVSIILCAGVAVFIRTEAKPTVLGTSDTTAATPTVCQAKCCQGVTVISTDPDCADTINAKCDVYSGLEGSSNCTISYRPTNPTPYPASYPRSIGALLLSNGLSNSIKGNAYHNPIYVHYDIIPEFISDDALKTLLKDYEVTVEPKNPLPTGLTLQCPTSLTEYYPTLDNTLRICNIDGIPQVAGQFNLDLIMHSKKLSTNDTIDFSTSFPLLIIE